MYSYNFVYNVNTSYIYCTNIVVSYILYIIFKCLSTTVFKDAFVLGLRYG